MIKQNISKQTAIQLNESYVRVNKDIEKDKYWDSDSSLGDDSSLVVYNTE